MIDDKLLALLACPACQGHVALQKDETPPAIVCLNCGRRYPIVNGIPVLVTDTNAH